MTQTRRRRLNDKQIRSLKVKGLRYALPDPELVGHYVRVHPTGAKTFVAVARDPLRNHKQIWTTIGSIDHLSIDEAREKAREIIKRVRAGKPATEPPPPAQDSFAVVAENWIKRHVVARGLRSKDEIERSLAKYVLPSWRDRSFTEIKRRDVALLLDDIEDNHGARQADAVLTIIRSIANWYATRDDNYVVPIVKGMKRATNGSRARILNDDELRIIWKAGEDSGPFGSLVQMALLTAQRRDKLLNMRWSDISANGVWSIPSWHSRSCTSSRASSAPSWCSHRPTARVASAAVVARRRSTQSCRRTCRAGRSTISGAPRARSWPAQAYWATTPNAS